MQVNHVMLCDFVIPASGQQKQSIIGIFQAFNVPKLPFQIPRFFVVFEVEGESAESGKIDLAVLVQDGDGGELFKLTGEAEVSSAAGERWRLNHSIEVINLPIQRRGGHQVVVLLNGKIEAVTRFDVNLLEAQAGS